jgi:hypothetical protein
MGLNRQPLEIPARCGLTVPSGSLQAITGAERSARLTCLLTIGHHFALRTREIPSEELRPDSIEGTQLSAQCLVWLFLLAGGRYIAVEKNEYSGYLNDGGRKHLSTGTARKRLHLWNLAPMGAHVANGLSVVAGVLLWPSERWIELAACFQPRCLFGVVCDQETPSATAAKTDIPLTPGQKPFPHTLRIIMHASLVRRQLGGIVPPKVASPTLLVRFQNRTIPRH